MEDGVVVFMAAVEATSIGDDNVHTEDFVGQFIRSVRRLRVTRADLRASASASMEDGQYTCEHLHHSIASILRRKMLRAAEQRDESLSSFVGALAFAVEVYDSKANAFRRLLEEDTLTKSALTTFGSSRLRCAVSAVPPRYLPSARQPPTADSLAICGRAFPFRPEEGIVLQRRIATVHESVTIHIQERHNIQSGETGWNVWDGAVLLTRYLENHPELVQSKRVLELGSGCGLVGIAAAVLGARHVVLTDLPYALPLLQQNVRMNLPLFTHDNVQLNCSACDWFHPPSLEDLGFRAGKSDRCTRRMKQLCSPNETASAYPSEENRALPVQVILVADCFWIDTLVSPLLQTLAGYSSESEATVLISYQRRGKTTHEAVWKGLHSIFMTVVEVNLAEEANWRYPSDLLFLFRCCGRRLY